METPSNRKALYTGNPTLKERQREESCLKGSKLKKPKEELPERRPRVRQPGTKRTAGVKEKDACHRKGEGGGELIRTNTLNLADPSTKRRWGGSKSK